MTHGVLGLFTDEHAAVEATRRLKAAGLNELTIYSPAPTHAFEEVLGHPVSGVRLFTLFAGILGTTAGFALTIWTSLDWPLVVGGKSIVSIAPYIIIAFELTILFAGLASLLGVLVLGHLPARRLEPTYRPEFGDDRFGIYVWGGVEALSRAEALLRECGAVEVERAVV